MFEEPAEHGPITARLGAYEIIRPLARGGMAQLFLARAVGPEGFEKVVVLKRILPHHAENPKHMRAFFDEAKLVAGFDHPHIAHVYDMGTLDGSYFFTMEHVHGPNVHAVLKRCKQAAHLLPIEHAVLIARDIASALHYAHERRGSDRAPLHVVHRDVSPSNIIVSYDGVPKLIDFGIAKAASSSMRTQTGALKGKISYMSPEQARGAPLDRRSDVFSLGIVLWEMIACRRLYKSDNDLTMLERIIREAPPSLMGKRAGCLPDLAGIVEKALALDPDARYQTAQELQLGLEEFARHNRLAQSRVALSSELQELFAEEIQQWNEAEQASPTVTDAQAAPPRDRTMQVTFGDLEIVAPDDDDDYGDDDDTIAPPPRISRRPETPLAPPPAPAAAAWAIPSAPALVGRHPVPTPVTLSYRQWRLQTPVTEPRPSVTPASETLVTEPPPSEPPPPEALVAEPSPSETPAERTGVRWPLRLAIGAAGALAVAVLVAKWPYRGSAREPTAIPSDPEAAPSAVTDPPAAPPAPAPALTPAPAAAAAGVDAKPAIAPAPAEPTRKSARKTESTRKSESTRKPPRTRAVAKTEPAKTGSGASEPPAEPASAKPAAPKPEPKPAAPKPEPKPPAPKPEPKPFDPNAVFPP